jgi:type I restriction enzyme S subunit
MGTSWIRKKLGEICHKIKAGGTPSRKVLEYWNGDIPFVKIEDISSTNLYLGDTQEKISQKGLENSNAWILPPNSVLFSIYGSIGEVAINKIPVATNQAILGLIPKNEIINHKFLAYSLKAFGKYLISYNIQSTQKNLTLEIVKNFEIPLPPLPIQQKIVRILDTIQEAIDIQEKIIEKTKELKKSLMAELFKYGGPSFRKGRKLKKTEIGEIPEDWEVVRLGEVALDFLGGGTPSTNVREYWDGEIPWTTSSIIEEGKVCILKNGQRYITHLGYENSSTKIVPAFNLLVGTRVGVGKVAINEIDIAVNQDLTGIIINREKINLFYLAYTLTSPRCQAFFYNYKRGATIKGIPRSDLETMLIPLAPLPEQQEIAEILQTIDQKIEIEKRKKELYEELFKTMLNKIMSQEIDVEKIEV